MSRTRKEKMKKYPDSSLLTPENSAEEITIAATDDYIETTLERKKEADKPLYFKRI
jgi:hypothetical protein